MKTKANTLIEDGQDIKVKNIVLGDDISIKKDGNDNLQIENQIEGIVLKDGYDHIFSITDEAFNLVYDVTNLLHISNTGVRVKIPLYFLPHTTAERPTAGVFEGAVIYDSTLKKCILYNGTAWVNLMEQP